MHLHNNQHMPKLTGTLFPPRLREAPVCRNSNNMVDMEVDILPLRNTRIYTAELLILSTISRLR